MYDVSHTRPKQDTAAAVVHRTLGHWKRALDGGAKEDDGETASASLNYMLDALPPADLCDGPRVDVNGKVTRVIDRTSFEKWYVRPGPSGRFTRPNDPTKGAIPQQLKPGDVVARAMFSKPGRVCYWITKATVLERICAEFAPEEATRIRDYLGLKHIEDGTELVQLIYPPNVLDGVQVAAPTFIEGACNHVYRSGEGGDRWGRAVDLLAPKNNNPEELAPEAVHKAIPFSAEFMVQSLGVVKGTRPCDPCPFRDGLPRTWDDGDVDGLSDYTATKRLGK